MLSSISSLPSLYLCVTIIIIFYYIVFFIMSVLLAICNPACRRSFSSCCSSCSQSLSSYNDTVLTLCRFLKTCYGCLSSLILIHIILFSLFIIICNATKYITIFAFIPSCRDMFYYNFFFICTVHLVDYVHLQSNSACMFHSINH